jgi:hypothetical protein
MMSCVKSQSAHGVWLPTWLSFLSGVPEPRRRKRLLIMNQGFVDDSGAKGQGEVLVFSSLSSTAEVWAAIVDRWDACLRESPSIRYFKMDEAAGRNGQFYGFSEVERDQKLRSLCAIMNTSEIAEFSCVMVLEDFDKYWVPRIGRPACEPYFFPFQVMCSGIPYEFLRRGATEPCEIFFDEHVIFGPRAKAWYPVFRESYPPHLRVVMPVEPFFRSDLDVLPLQMADLTAWMQRNANESGLGEFEWLWDELSSIPRSDHSPVIDGAWIDKTFRHQQTPEERERNAAVLNGYREVFGHEWPPKTKMERKKMQARKGV